MPRRNVEVYGVHTATSDAASELSLAVVRHEGVEVASTA